MRMPLIVIFLFLLSATYASSEEVSTETLEVLSIDRDQKTVTLLRAKSDKKIINQTIHSVHLSDCYLKVLSSSGKTVTASAQNCPSFHKLEVANHFDYEYVSQFQIESTKYLALPVPLRLEGVSNSLNLVAAARNLWKDKVDLYIGGAMGSNQGGVLAYVTRIPTPIPGLTFEGGLGYLNNLDLEVSYTRGFAEDQPFVQNLDMSGLVIKSNYSYFDNKLVSSVLLAQTHTTINEFKDTNFDRVEMPSLSLTPIDATLLQLKTNYYSSAHAKSKISGIALGITIDSQFGRVGQSNEAAVTFDFSTYQPIYNEHHITYHFLYSDAFVLNEKTKYTDVTTVKDTLKTDCSSLTGVAQEKCDTLNNNLADYIATNNKYGLAKPLGGNTLLRAFREMRFRAAYTRYMGFEYQMPLFKYGKDLKINWVTAAEAGFASDYISQVFTKSVASVSTGVWAYYKEFPLRLEYGASGENNAWFLSVQRPF